VGNSALVHRQMDIDGYLNACTVHLLLFVFQPTNAQTHTYARTHTHIYITTIYLYIMFIPACFDICVSSSGSFYICASLSYIYFKIEAVKLQFHKIITLKYIKIHILIYKIC